MEYTWTLQVPVGSAIILLVLLVVYTIKSFLP